MTEPPQFGSDPNGHQNPPSGYPPPGYPPPGYPPTPGYPPPGGYGASPRFGYHPVTGEPLSEKSKMAAALLQLLGLIGLLGIGRMYMGQTTFGVAQLIGGLVITVVTCGFGVAVPVIWGIVDCIILMTGSPRDQYARLLRDG